MGKVDFRFVRLQNYTNAPTIGGLFFVTDDNATLNVVSCSILAHWVPVELWIDPKADLTIHDDTANPLDIFNSNLDFSNLTQLEFSEAWLDQLNKLSNAGMPNAIAGLITSTGDSNSTDKGPHFWATHQRVLKASRGVSVRFSICTSRTEWRGSHPMQAATNTTTHKILVSELCTTITG